MPLSSANSSHNTSPDDQLESCSYSSLNTSKPVDGNSSASNIDQGIEPTSNKDALIAAQTATTVTQPIRKRRVGKACDCCRIKKTKCDGKKPCSKCVMDNKVCIYTERKKSKDKVYSNDYVELIEKRLNLVGKALENLCELVKLDSNYDELQKFKSSLHINDVDEERISLNEAITLLVDETEIIETQPQVADFVGNGLIQQIIEDTRFEPETPGFNTKVKQEEETTLPSSIPLGTQQMADGYKGNTLNGGMNKFSYIQQQQQQHQLPQQKQQQEQQQQQQSQRSYNKYSLDSSSCSSTPNSDELSQFHIAGANTKSKNNSTFSNYNPSTLPSQTITRNTSSDQDKIENENGLLDDTNTTNLIFEKLRNSTINSNSTQDDQDYNTLLSPFSPASNPLTIDDKDVRLMDIENISEKLNMANVGNPDNGFPNSANPMFPNDTFYSNDKSNTSTSKNGIPKYRQNSNLFENNERTMNSMGFNPLDLGPFNSGAQIAAAAVNGLFQGSNNNGFSMSDFENNPNGIGSSKSNSGLDTVSSSPVSDQISLAFGIENTSLSHTNSNNSGVFNPLLNNGSNFDSLIHAPSSLNRNSNGSFMNNNSTDLNGASSTGSFMDNVNGNNSFDDSKLTFNGIPMSSNTTSSSSFNNADGISPPTTIRRSSSINSKNHINHHHSNGGTNHKAPHGNNNHHHSHSSLIHPYLSTSLSRTKSNSSNIGSPVLKSAESSSPTVRSSSFLNDTVSLFDNIKNFSNQT